MHPMFTKQVSFQVNMGPQTQQSQQLLQKFQKGMKRMSNGYRVTLFFDRFIEHDQNVVLALLATVVISVIYYELDFTDNHQTTTLVLLCGLVGASLMTIILLIFKHRAYNEWKKAELVENQVKSNWSLLIQILIILLQPYPFINQVTFLLKNNKTGYEGQYKLNYLLVVFSMLRFLFIIPIFFIKSKFMTPRSVRICKMYGCQPNFLYTIKCMFKQLPVKIVALWFIFSIALFSFLFRVAQRTTTTNVFNHFTNNLWFTLITMTTVGYGDMAPVTDIGRLLGILCVIWGGFLVSVMVVVLTNTFNLNQNQKRTLVILKRLEIKEEIKKVAGQYMRITLIRVWRNYKQLKKKRGNQKKSMLFSEENQNQAISIYFPETLKERKLKMQFHQLRRVSKMNLMDIDLKQDMTRHFQRIQSHLDSLKMNADNLIDYINGQYFSKGPIVQQQSIEQWTS